MKICTECEESPARRVWDSSVVNFLRMSEGQYVGYGKSVIYRILRYVPYPLPIRGREVQIVILSKIF